MRLLEITFVSLFCIVVFSAKSQNTIGIPNIINYPKQLYNAGSQNWGIAQDANGIMYFANNSGLLSFDGNFWRMYPLPNKTIVRSLAIGAPDKIYAGGQGEFGYFSPNKNGELTYTSLRRLIPKDSADFTDIWGIAVIGKAVFFRSYKKIFQLEEGKIKVFNSINWQFMGEVGSKLFAFDYTNGLVEFSAGKWVSALDKNVFPPNIRITTMLPLGEDSILITSMSHGAFVLHNRSVSSFQSPAVNDIKDRNISKACLLSYDRIAFVTNLLGCVIANRKGELVQKFSNREGMQSNNVLSMFLDRDNNLWLGLNNGIDLVGYDNSIKNIFPNGEERSAGFSSIIHDNELYLSISTGEYYNIFRRSLFPISTSEAVVFFLCWVLLKRIW